MVQERRGRAGNSLGCGGRIGRAPLARHVGSVKMAGRDAVNAIVERRSHDRYEMTAEVGETFRGIAIDGFGGSHRA